MFLIRSNEKDTGSVFKTGMGLSRKETSFTEEYGVKELKKAGNYEVGCRGPTNANTYLEIDGVKHCQNRALYAPPEEGIKVFIGTPPPPPVPMYAPDAAKEAVAGAQIQKLHH